MPERKPRLTSRRVQNAARTQIEDFFTAHTLTSPKHNHYYDYGYPDKVSFDQFYQMYTRNGIASAGVKHAINRTWRENPILQDGTLEPHEPTKNETNFNEMAERLNLWQQVRECDERSRVGKYGALVLRIADGKQMKEPVDRVSGFDALVEAIPCFEEQLTATSWDEDQTSPTYGKPTMYQFNEGRVNPQTGKNRSFEVHPDRVIIWSADGSIYGKSVLEPGYNDLLVIEKVVGAGGEGFWKNAKSAPILNVSPEANLQSLAAMLGTDIAGIADKMDDVVTGWQKGFDQLLMLQGIDAKALGITLPQPQEFVGVALQSFAASINEPLKILIGSQSGERASTEDAKEWDSTIMARRENYVKPNLRSFIQRLVRFGIMPDRNWLIWWADLTEDSTEEKLAKAQKMAEINRLLIGTGQEAFSADEIREAAGYDNA